MGVRSQQSAVTADEVARVEEIIHKHLGRWFNRVYGESPSTAQELAAAGGNMLYRYALVPALANAEGLQPVVFVDPYEEIYALPVASDLNRFFDAFSHYVKILAEDPEYRATGAPVTGFPWRTPELIAKDSRLVEMIKQGLFDRLMYESTKAGRHDEAGIAETQRWIGAVLAASLRHPLI